MGTAGYATQNLKLMVIQQSVIELVKTDLEKRKSMCAHVPDSIAIGRCRPNVSIRYENAFETKKENEIILGENRTRGIYFRSTWKTHR